ncbi:ParB N-terminal domain-containing protein [Ruegeria sp. R13_0]|uniref:ParB/RepB/Spo0J family partition protein n=1 Tax=Ruegeria sp. R13_0 TaxID=2821099 RepID=UPI001ADCB106|nr:ParB N-terminal domain-containing protein [Ruegeria sp. R13_0]MBO9436761.1 ParB N-terminal domain-containing protein [Ruegeria sp. R13_0]
MAKRKRLTPARADFQSSGTPDITPETKSMFPPVQSAPPIAQVAGDTALQAAVDDLSAEIRTARAEGRLVQQIPLMAIEEAHLVRDRIAVDGEEMSALVESIRARGQQTPIELVQLAEDRFGLISGWRRLTALKALHAETGEDRFATVQALLRRPESASDAYLAMVEENEIRVGLSYYERARIAARAAEQGVYPDEASALRGLFASVSRAKRSKIGSFITIYHALDDHLRFAAAIPERLGLSLSKALKGDPALGVRIARELNKAQPDTAEAEAALLSGLSRAGPGGEQAQEPPTPEKETIGPFTLTWSASGETVMLTGMSDTLQKRLKIWLAEQV